MRFLLILSVLCAGCAHTTYKQPPSTATAQRLVTSSRGKVDTALSDNEEASNLNRRARTRAELIDNKASVIQKYWQ